MSGTAVRAHPRAGANGGEPARAADVFVAFGITGDLAKVMTFRSLYRLERRGPLPRPPRGRPRAGGAAGRGGRGGPAPGRGRGRAGGGGGGEPLDPEVFDRFAARMS